MTSIGTYAFEGCSGLTSIDIPTNVTSIGDNAFSNCDGLITINIPINVINIGYGILHDCQNLTSITVTSGNSVYDSRNNCNAIIETSTNTLIQGCDSTVIPESVTKIGDYAFYNCNLKSINIPGNVTSIGKSAFESYFSLRDIYCYSATPATVYDNSTFSSSSYRYATLHVPYGSIDAYKAAEGWKNFTNIVESDPTDVEAVSADKKADAERKIYTLGGVRIAAPQKGLNIINGKKVVY